MPPHKPAPPNRRPCPRTHHLCLALRELKIPLLLEGVPEGRGSDASITAKLFLWERRRSLQRVAEGRGSDASITAKLYDLSLAEASSFCNPRCSGSGVWGPAVAPSLSSPLVATHVVLALMMTPCCRERHSLCYGLTSDSVWHDKWFKWGSFLFSCWFQQGSERISKHSAMNQQGDSNKSAVIQRDLRENQQGMFEPKGSLRKCGWTVNWWTLMFFIYGNPPINKRRSIDFSFLLILCKTHSGSPVHRVTMQFKVITFVL